MGTQDIRLSPLYFCAVNISNNNSLKNANVPGCPV